MHLPVKMWATTEGITLRLSDRINSQSATDPNNYLIETWDLRRSANYGSDRFNERTLEIKRVDVDADGRMIHLRIPDIEPTWTIQIAYKLRDEQGRPFGRLIQGTIHELANSEP